MERRTHNTSRFDMWHHCGDIIVESGFLRRALFGNGHVQRQGKETESFQVRPRNNGGKYEHSTLKQASKIHQHLQLSIKAELKNVTNLVPASDDFEYFFKVHLS